MKKHNAILRGGGGGVSFLVLFFLLVMATPAMAFFDARTISKQTEINGVGQYTFFSATTDNPITIQSARIQQSGIQSETFLYCGTQAIAKNYGVRDYSLDLMNYPCFDTFYADKTGMRDSAFI